MNPQEKTLRIDEKVALRGHVVAVDDRHVTIQTTSGALLVVPPSDVCRCCGGRSPSREASAWR